MIIFILQRKKVKNFHILPFKIVKLHIFLQSIKFLQYYYLSYCKTKRDNTKKTEVIFNIQTCNCAIDLTMNAKKEHENCAILLVGLTKRGFSNVSNFYPLPIENINDKVSKLKQPNDFVGCDLNCRFYVHIFFFILMRIQNLKNHHKNFIHIVGFLHAHEITTFPFVLMRMQNLKKIYLKIVHVIRFFIFTVS